MNSFFKLICLSILSFGLAYSTFAQDFYDVSTVQTIEVTFSQPNWDQLMDNAKSTTGDYIMAQTVAINGEALDSVGVKFKGNSSYNANQAKNPWHIELNTYKDQDYQGYKDIKLSNGHKDPSFLRDVLGFQIARQYMDAPKSNFTNLYVNGVLIGLYTNTESITKAFVDDRFDSKNNSFFNCSPPAGAGPGLNDFPNLEYLGADSANYYDSYDMKSTASWQDLIDLCDTLKNHNTSIEHLLDVDRALWMLAFDNAIVNLDSYIGQFKQNYYLYRDDFGRFLPIVWDLNESFGTFSGTGSGNLNSTIAKQQMDHLLHSSDADFPLFSQLMAIPTYKKMYLAHIKTIMSENFSPTGSYASMAQAIQNTASSSYQNDPNTAYTYNQFILNLNTDVSGGGGGPGGGNAPGITNLMNGRYSHLFSQSDFTATQPNISDISLSNPAPTTGGVISITAKVNDAENVYLRHRNQDHAPFAKTELFDDGNHNDGAAGDNIYGADLNITSIKTDYYIYAENSTIGRFSPARAQHEFYSINVTGGISPGDIVINEFMASNNTTTSDSDGEFDDWIELYNNSTSAIDISGYGLSDNMTNLSLFSFPSGTTLQANDYIIVWADKDLSQSGHHADFKLSANGETIYLSDDNQELIDSVIYSSLNSDEAFGRYPNGVGIFQSLNATFDGNNDLGQHISIPEIINPDEIVIYPNPARDQFTIQNLTNLNQNLPLVIYNATGTLVYQAHFQESTDIDVNQWADGIYFVQIGTLTKKLVIVR